MTPPVDKRAFLAGTACLTRGWYAARQPRGAIAPGLAWRFFTGGEVGRIAREQLGHGIQLPSGSTQRAVEATTAALADPAAMLLFEATFVHGPFVARADVLRRSGDGWDLIEVKSSKLSPEGEASDEAIDDLAYTTFVVRAAGLPIRRLCLMLIEPDYRLAGDTALLREIDVTEAAMTRAEEWARQAEVIAQAILPPERPLPVLQLICRSCEFFRRDCLGADVPDSILLLPRLSAKRFEAIKQFERISALPHAAELTPPQARVARVIRSGLPDSDAAGLARMQEIVWPAYYLDFESVSPGLPWFPATAPYEAIPFQYSLHIRHSPAEEPVHSEYLAPLGADWRQPLAEQLLGALGTRGSVITYSGYEKRMLRHLASVLPGLGQPLERVIDRLFDLETVVKEGYCHPCFDGHTSIKYVLPALVPGLSYAALDIAGGEDAAGAFGLMWVGEWSEARHAATRQQLLAYCALDTMAMVRVHEAMLRIWEGVRSGRG